MFAMAQWASPLMFLGPIGWPEIVVIVIVALILFGGKKLPELARGVGKGMREFKRELRGLQEDVELEPDEPELPRPKKRRPPEARAEEDYTADLDEDYGEDYAHEQEGEEPDAQGEQAPADKQGDKPA